MGGRSMRDVNAREWEGRGMHRSEHHRPDSEPLDHGALGTRSAVPRSQFGPGQSSRYGHEEPGKSVFFRGT